MATSKITPIDYSSRDFVSLINDMEAQIPSLLPEWTSRNPNDFGIVLLELFAYMGDIANYYVDRVANELFLSTARRRESIVAIANMLNYTPTAMTAATTTLQFTTLVGSGAVTIPKGAQVSTVPTTGSAGTVFETAADLTILGKTAATPQYTGTVAANEGTTVVSETLTNNADGSLGQFYTLFNPNVIQGSIALSVTDPTNTAATWVTVARLLDVSTASAVYETSIDENNVMSVIFGDNINGAAPVQGSVITATYRIGSGALGNAGAGLLVELRAPKTNVVSVVNPGAATGGADAESIESMRSHIPSSFYALNRAVTLADYKALAIQSGIVAKAKATASVYTSVLLYVAPVGDSGGVCTGPDTLVGTQKYSLQRYFDDKKLINVTITLADPTYVGVNVAATVQVLPQFYQPTVKNAVSAAVQSLVAFNAVTFGQSITTSQVYHAIQDVPGVDYVSLTLLVRTDAATQAGVQDVIMGVSEIAKAGTLTFTLNGGVS